MITPQQNQNLIDRVRIAWAKACLFDNVPVGSSFVVFTENNPYVAEHDKAMAAYFELCKS